MEDPQASSIAMARATRRNVRQWEAIRPLIQQLNERRLPIPWLAGLILQVEIAARPPGLAAVPQVLEQRILANCGPPGPL